MKIIQTNLLMSNLNTMGDFQSCVYNVNFNWDEFKEVVKHRDSINFTNKILRKTMDGIGEIMTCLIYDEELNKESISDEFHFDIIYKDLRGGFTKSMFYKISD